MEDLKIIKNKLKFIKAIQDDVIIINKKNTKEVVEQLESNKFDKIDDSYSYLLDLKIHTLTSDKYSELKKKFDDLVSIYKELKETTIENLYLKDLKEAGDTL
jgi:DNA topoisomerase-2